MVSCGLYLRPVGDEAVPQWGSSRHERHWTSTHNTSSSNLRISGDDNLGSVYFDGLIDEVGVYNRALSDGEIAAIYNAGSAGKCRPPRVATATATLVDGFVVAATLTDGGYGYTNTPLVRFIGGGGSGTQAVDVVSNGVVIAVNVLDAGSGYTKSVF